MRCSSISPALRLVPPLGPISRRDAPHALPGYNPFGRDTPAMADTATPWMLRRGMLRRAGSRVRAMVDRRRVRATMAANPLSAAELWQLDRARVGDMRGLRIRDERGDWATL
jgi:hypothetical protein